MKIAQVNLYAGNFKLKNSPINSQVLNKKNKFLMLKMYTISN